MCIETTPPTIAPQANLPAIASAATQATGLLMSEAQRQGVLTGISEGRQRFLAAREVGVSYAMLRATIKADRTYHRELVFQEICRDDMIDFKAMQFALKGDTRFVARCLNLIERRRADRTRRRERSRQARQADADRALVPQALKMGVDLPEDLLMMQSLVAAVAVVLDGAEGVADHVRCD